MDYFLLNDSLTLCILPLTTITIYSSQISGVLKISVDVLLTGPILQVCPVIRLRLFACAKAQHQNLPFGSVFLLNGVENDM